ncbi:hypothetical protein Tco_1360713 [Tanacetum coccineum]
MRNPELEILKKLDRVMANGQFTSAYPAGYANFMPYLSSDHCPAVLTIPDVIRSKPRSFRFMNFLADKSDFLKVVKDNWNVEIEGYNMFKLTERLKALKKHMINMNKKNGNVFDKAYKYASIDEEKLLRQKTKVEWLKEEDSNTKYFHNVIKGRFVFNFSNFLGTCDKIFKIEDPASLFTKKLDVEKAVEMIKPISDEEIKGALFSIEDNKSAGPNGYTSRFFKAAWSVVGHDVCSAVKEFFISGMILGELNSTLISLILKEFMKGYNWDVGVRNYAFKIDIQKAYDTVSWEFLDNTLRMFGFHPVMIH